MSTASPSAATELTIQFLDVGQGDGIYVEFPDGKNMLVDFGSTKNKADAGTDALAYLQKSTRFKKTGQTLNYLVLTHGDRDHYNNVPGFVQQVQPKIRNLLFGGKQSDYGKVVSDLIAQQPGMTVLQPPSAGPFDLGTFGGAQVRVLAVNAPSNYSLSAWRKNTSSVVLQISFGGNSVILAGDATIDTESYILATAKQAKKTAGLRANVLKVQHHGSARTSLRPAFIKAVSPEYVFLSSDRSGTLGGGERSTGHRLPQELGLDLIRENTTLATGAKHRYFSSFDPADYTNYVNPDTGTKDMVPPAKPTTRAWLNPQTAEAIFTSLGQLDKPYKSGPADEGLQYGLTLRSDGSIDIAVTS